MRRNLAFGVRPAANRSVSSVACLAFVSLVGAAFWAGVVYIAQALMQMAQHGGF
jgi:hypothetical protein